MTSTEFVMFLWMLLLTVYTTWPFGGGGTMNKIIVEGRLLGWKFGDWKALINSYNGGYDLFRDMVKVGWFRTLKTARMYALNEERKDR